MNLSFISSTTFHHIQTFYVIPSNKEVWGERKGKIWNLFKKEVLVLCGNRRMDSPGFSAKYCLYIMMDHFLDLIVDVEVVYKREAGSTSSLMEKMGCKRILKGELRCKNELFSCESSNIFLEISFSCLEKLCKRPQNFYVEVSLKFDEKSVILDDD